MSYKVEELLAMRDSVSESAVSIDKFADEDVIKEHVLRPSASASLVVGASEKPLRSIATVPAISAATSNLKKPSPSPSVKRGKAERLLKEHGSPPGMRVTAGGRVVPSDLPPLSNARFGSNNLKPQSLRSISPGNFMAAHQQQFDVNNVPQVEVIGTQAVIRVGDRMFALPAFAPNLSGTTNLSNIAPMPSVIQQGLDAAQPAMDSGRFPPPSGMSHGNSLTDQQTNVQTQPNGSDLASLLSQQSVKKQELKNVQQAEVWGMDTNGPTWRQEIIAKKKSLILELDALRKQINAAEDASKNNQTGGHMNEASTAPVLSPAFVPQFQQGVNGPSFSTSLTIPFGMPTPNQYSPLMMYPNYPASHGPATGPSQFSRDSQFFVSPDDTAVNTIPLPTPVQGPKPAQSPGAASRRSHAIEIKPPREDVRKAITHGSTLDPKSPTYEPVPKFHGKTVTKASVDPPTPSPAKQSPWRLTEVPSTRTHRNQNPSVSQKPSLSSIDTTDFFPTNTHEHSSTRLAPEKVSKQSSRENITAPITPERTWATGPWNSQQSSGRSARQGSGIQDEPSKRLTSWPEAFGKQPPQTMASANVLHKMSAQPVGNDPSWPPMSAKPVVHIPSTYQEGYQAGLHHAGLPQNLDFLSGFFDGLAGYLKDRKSGNTPPWSILGGPKESNGTSSGHSSIRGYLSGATLHDALINLSENIPSGKMSIPSSIPRAAQGDAGDPSITYAFCNEAARESPKRIHSATRKQDTFTQKSSGATRVAEVSQAKNGFARSFTKHQAGSHASGGNTAPFQRFYPSPKEYVSGTGNQEPLASRPVTRHRISGLDGATDDLAGLVIDTSVQEKSTESDASCFKSSSSKSKQKAPSSPSKQGSSQGNVESSPVNASSTPKKSGELSPAKAKLEQVTNKLRRPKKEDARNLSPEEKQKRTAKWRTRFQNIRKDERAEIYEYLREHPRK